MEPKKDRKLTTFILPLFLAAGHIGLVAKRDLVTFHWDQQSYFFIGVIVALAILFTYGFYLLLCRAVTRWLAGEEKFRKRAPFFLGYFLFMCIFWLLTWPGIFKGDEFYVLKAALSFQFSGMQGGLTSLFYILTLLFFPSMASITFFQLLLVCSIFAVVMCDLFEKNRGWVRFLYLIPFVLPPVIDANLFTLRATPAGWLFLLLLDRIGFAPFPKEGKKRSLYIGQIALLCGLVTALRSEYFYLLVLVPLGLLLFRSLGKKETAILFAVAIVFWQALCVPNRIAQNGQNKYPISLVLNPLANLFTEAESLKGPQVYDDIMTINELVDVQLLRQNASVRNISQYWNIPDVLPKEQLSAFMKASLRLIAYNPGKFLKYRWQTFAYTNGFYPGYINHPGGEDVDAINLLNYYGTDYGAYFAFSRPLLGFSLRQRVISLLACRSYQKGNIRTNALLPVFYNVLPVCITLLAAFFISLFAIKRKGPDGRKKCLLQVLTILQFFLIFLTAPAMFFMYYFCLYLCGWVLCLDTLVFVTNKADSANGVD